MTRIHPRYSARKLFVSLCFSVTLGACAVTAPEAPGIAPLANHAEKNVPDVDLLRVSPAMREFVEVHAVDRGRGNEKAWSLAHAALNPYVFPFDYNPQVTLPADQAFQAKTGNCLTFSSIFIAMARSAGLDAWYQEIQIPTSWSSVNETLLVSKHVNAVIQHEGRKYTVDVSLLEQDDSHRARRLSDREATAQFYNNLGADALVQNKLAQAFAYFKKALGTHPNLAYVWSNLGVVYSRNEQVQDAIAAYRHSIQLEPDQTVALNNLFLIYEEQGDLEAAAKIQSRVESNRRRNPYYLNHLAETANEEKRYADAIKLVKRAIGMDENEYRFHYTLAQSYYHLGEIETARSSLAKARELAPDDLPDGPLMLSGQE